MVAVDVECKACSENGLEHPDTLSMMSVTGKSAVPVGPLGEVPNGTGAGAKKGLFPVSITIVRTINGHTGHPLPLDVHE